MLKKIRLDFGEDAKNDHTNLQISYNQAFAGQESTNVILFLTIWWV
jgi:hypothetical protein